MGGFFGNRPKFLCDMVLFCDIFCVRLSTEEMYLMRIAVAGLGIIGGSCCMALKRAGHAVDGWNRSPLPLETALKENYIDEEAKDFEGYDVVFVALPPEATVNFINGHEFRDGAVVADMCGVKRYIVNHVEKRNFSFVSCHPMAGKETSGLSSASADLFVGADMIIARDPETDENAARTIMGLAKDMGFARAVRCSSKTHDEIISYTSQLPHIISNAYCGSDKAGETAGFTAGSYQDMTRISAADENLWAELYKLDSDNLIRDIDNLMENLLAIRSVLLYGPEESIKNALRENKEKARAAKENATAEVEIVDLATWQK